MRAIVVNCSFTPKHHCYNLGARKLTDWLKTQGYQVMYVDGDPGLWGLDADLICLSVIFSWHAPIAREIALRMKDRAEVWCGGPGVFALTNWWQKETGLDVIRGLDERFDKQRGSYMMTFASRGCPVNCSFCIVPRLEGTSFTFDPDFLPAPMLCDNNLSALPAIYQDHIIQRYQAYDVRLEDANSGFEPRYFTEETYQRWKPLMKTAKAWRFAFDECLGERGRHEAEGVEGMMRILKDVPASRKRVYCLVGNEPLAICYERAMKIIEWGGEPHCQFVLPLNWLGDPQKVKVRYDWKSYKQGQDFCRYFNTWGWRSYPIWEYKPRVNEPCPFISLQPTAACQASARVNLAINHWARAIETHNTNYPEVTHALTDLHMANPRRFPGSTILEGSPECTEHTLAKGRKRTGQGQLELWDTSDPSLVAAAEERSRCTMWTPLDWAECHNYQAIILENVVDVHLWRPFQAWLQAWRSLGYEFELVYLNSMYVHPTPQSRDRMYFVAWKQGNRRPNLKITPAAHCMPCAKEVAAVQSWKNPARRYGKYKQQYTYRCPLCAQEVTPYYYAAATAIDWSLSAQRIGDRKKPLQVKTLNRIQYGLEKFAREPFTINLNHPEPRPVVVGEDAFHTQTADDATGLAVPSPFILDHLGEYRPRSITRQFSTMCAAGNHHSVILPSQTQAYLMTYYNHGQLLPVQEAAPTVTTLERHALVTTEHAIPELEECGFRMLAPHEIQSAMAFPASYIVTGTRRERVKQLGNAVTPPVMKLLMERVLASLATNEQGGLQ